MEDFDVEEYIRIMVEGDENGNGANKLLKDLNFHFSTASNIGDMADMLYESRDYENHFVLVDTNTSNTQMQRGGGFNETMQYTCFMLMRFEPGDEKDRKAKRKICRKIQRSILSKILLDGETFEEDELQFFDTQNILTQYIQDFMLNGLTGMWFVFQLPEPRDLRYNKNEWN